MCFSKNKWQKFTPTDEYIEAIKSLTSVSGLYSYSQKFKYISEEKDYWRTPVEFMLAGGGDCEDWARWYVDILVRIQEKEGARFVIHGGYNKNRWGNKLVYHAITVFPYQGKLALFNVNQRKTGYKDFVETGYLTFPDGLKYMEIRNWEGKILEKKRKWFGIF